MGRPCPVPRYTNSPPSLVGKRLQSSGRSSLDVPRHANTTRPSVELWTFWVAPPLTSWRYAVDRGGACHMPHIPQRAPVSPIFCSGLHQCPSFRPDLVFWQYPFIARRKEELHTLKTFRYKAGRSRYSSRPSLSIIPARIRVEDIEVLSSAKTIVSTAMSKSGSPRFRRISFISLARE